MSLDVSRMEQELRAHANWVRALARSLVQDEASAEDLAQDTWLAALRHPAREGTSMRAWLGTVVRRIAWKRQRDARTTQTHTHGALDEHGHGGPQLHERLERLELHEVLAAELRTLREPLRTTLLERYFEGLSAAEIAARSGVPAPTVRWRLQQGLDELRTRLDRRFGGDRNTWMSALAFALPVKKAATVSGLGIGGGLLMSTWMKLALGAAALVAAALIARPLLQHEVAQPAPPALAETHDAPLARPEGEQPAELVSDAPTARTELASAASGAPTSAPAGATDTLVVARFLDEQQHPIANAWLRRQRGSTAANVAPNDEPQPSANDGRARLRVRGTADGDELQLEGGAPGFATTPLSGTPTHSGSLDLGDAILHPGGSVRGRVVDGAGDPIAKATIVVAVGSGGGPAADLELLRSRGPDLAGSSCSTRSEIDGRFLVDGIAVGGSRVWASVRDSRWTVSPPIDIKAGQTTDEIVLTIVSRESTDPELADIEGLVLDADGKPLAAPRIWVQQESSGQSFADALVGDSEGHFRIHPKMRAARIRLEVSDAEGRCMRSSLTELRAGTKGIEIRLLAPRTTTFDVRDERGAVEDFRVRWLEREGWPPSAPLDGEHPHVGGRAVVRLPAEASTFRIEAAGHRNATVGPIDGRAPPASISVSLTSTAQVRGRVLADGRGVPGAQLLLCRQPELLWSTSNGYVTLVDKANAPRATSGEQGEFALDLEKDGRFAILAEAPGYARSWFGPVALSAAAGISDLEIPLVAGGTLEGDVLMPPGRSPAGITVGINCGDGDPRVQAVDASGHFRFEHLMPGSWELRQDLPTGLVDEESFPKRDGKRLPARIREDARIVAGETTRRDLDLREQRACVVDIELLLNSLPAQGWHVAILPRRSGPGWGVSPEVSTDSLGHARLQLGFSGDCTLTAQPPAEQANATALRFELSLSGGSNHWTRDVRTGRIEGEIRDWDAKGKWDWYVRADGIPAFELHPDAHGHFSLASIPAGAVELYRAPRGVCATQVDAQRDLELTGGETRTIVLP